MVRIRGFVNWVDAQVADWVKECNRLKTLGERFEVWNVRTAEQLAELREMSRKENFFCLREGQTVVVDPSAHGLRVRLRG
jgi:hypothetical protein